MSRATRYPLGPTDDASRLDDSAPAERAQVLESIGARALELAEVARTAGLTSLCHMLEVAPWKPPPQPPTAGRPTGNGAGGCLRVGWQYSMPPGAVGLPSTM